MADIVIRKGDRLPVIERTVSIDGTPVDLTGGSVVFTVIDPATATTVFTGSAAIQSAVDGIVRYTWGASDTLTAGRYFAYFTATIGGKALTAPNDGYLTLAITDPDTGDFTYSGDPSARTIDALRFLIHDTDPTEALMTDSELQFILDGVNDSVYQAAHDACYVLAGHFARKADTSKSVGDLSLTTTYANRSQMYTDLAEKFVELAARRDPSKPWVNAQALKATADRVIETRRTDFWIGQTDYRS